MKKLKVLEKDLKSPYQRFLYDVTPGKKYIAHDFDPDVTKDYAPGLYATDIEGLPHSWSIHKRCFEVEVSGRSVIYDQYKQRFEHQTFIREVFKDELIATAKAKESELGYKLSEVLFPVNPLFIDAGEVTDVDVANLKKWIAIGDSVLASVRTPVWDSVLSSVRTSVWDSVLASAWDSVEAYISSLFPNIKKRKYIDHKEGVNPFQPGIDLWNRGLLPSYDGKTWRLHAGPKAKIVYEL
ncbi:MAG: hypothetical protein GF364_14960 [Candidatus Lokiarchaeota archaeon]|nr:hypothetical protein [Candidatus Lokiarchaeota archaeon]